MFPNALLRQRVTEVFSDFSKYYPMCDGCRKEIFELTVSRISRKMSTVPQETLESYYIEPQSRVDLTVELMKVAMMLEKHPNHDCSLRKTETVFFEVELPPETKPPYTKASGSITYLID